VVRERPALGNPFGVDGPWFAAILDVLGDLHDLLDARLPRPDQEGATRVTEPVPSAVPPGAVPVSEPAPDKPPVEAQPVTEPAPDREPEPDDEPEKAALPDPPPRSGRRSGLVAWQAFADTAQVPYGPDDSRDDIIAACVTAKVIPAE
jgi:hypothetical protein